MLKKVLVLSLAIALSITLIGCKPKVNEDAVPEIVVDNTKAVVFEVGEVEPDWTTYFLIEDENDGTIEVTTDMITEDVDMDTAGVYVVRVDVMNSVGSINFKEITIEVESDVEITVEYIMSNGVVGNTYKFENVEVVYKTNDEYGLYIYDANSESDVNYFYITAYEETLSDAMYDVNVGDMIDIAGELVLYRGNQQPRFENVSIIDKVGEANNPHEINNCEELTMDEYYALPWDTTDANDTNRDAWKTFGKCFMVQGVLKELHADAYYSVDPATDEYGLYAWAYGEGVPIADFENPDNLGKAITVKTFFYNMHMVGTLEAEYVRSALIDVMVNAELGAAVTEVMDTVLAGGSQVEENMTLPTSGTDYTVTWESSAPTVIATDGTVTRGQYNEDVTLSYVLTQGSDTFTGNVMVTVTGTVAAPEVDVNDGVLLELTLNDAAPDFTTYFTINDETDGVITVEQSMITTDLDMAVIGAYAVTISVTNTNDLTTEKTIIVNVSDGVTVIDAAWLITDVVNKENKLYTLSEVLIVSKGMYGDDGFVFDGTNFFYIDAYGSDFEADFIDAKVGDTITVTGALYSKYTYKYYLGDLVHFEVTEATAGDAFDWDSHCTLVTAAQLADMVTANDTYIKCFDVVGTVEEELYESNIYYNLADSVDNTKYFISSSTTPELPKQEFDLNTGQEITARMFLNYSRDDKSHYGYYWILDVVDSNVDINIDYIVTNRLDQDHVQLKEVTIVSKTKDETGLYVYDGDHFLYVNAYNTEFEDIAMDLWVGDTINVSGLYQFDYTYKMLIGDLTSLELVSMGEGTFDFSGKCIGITVSDLFAIKDTKAAFMNCYEVTGTTWLEDGTYMNFEDTVNPSEYFISYSYAPLEPKADFDDLGDGNDATVRMFYFRYRDDKSHGGYYWMLDVLSAENPVVTDAGEAKLLIQNDVEPDWTTYFNAYDYTDGDITVTAAMITESVDMATIGDYTVSITVTDADLNSTTMEITVTIVDPATIDIPWIIDNASAGQSFTLNNVTVASKTSDGSGMYVWDGEYFFYVNAYYSGDTLKNAAIALNEGDVITVEGDLYVNYTYKKQLDITNITLVSASTGEFDWTDKCIDITVSELFAIKDDGMTFVGCYNVTGTVWLEAGTYYNMMDSINTDEYFIEYGYGPIAGQEAFELLNDGDTFTVRMFLFRYRDDKSHGGYYWIDDVITE